MTDTLLNKISKHSNNTIITDAWLTGRTGEIVDIKDDCVFDSLTLLLIMENFVLNIQQKRANLLVQLLLQVWWVFGYIAKMILE